MAKLAPLLILLLAWQAKTAQVTPREIFDANNDATVRIYTNGAMNGCGFVVSEDGLVVTANHVVTTPESRFTQPFESIAVKIGKREHPATIVKSSQVNDVALLRIIAAQLPHVKLGKCCEIWRSEPIFVIAYYPETEFHNIPLLLQGTVAGAGVVDDGLFKGTEVIVFQAPIRKGFSGAPIFDKHGEVVGIVNTRISGISPELDEIRRSTAPEQSRGTFIDGVDVRKSVGRLINDLDHDLVTGLGSGVSIAYSEQMIDESRNQKH